jgi:TonB family protein
MIAAWMAYALVAGAFFGAAAWTVERLLRNHRRPSRFVWLGGMLLSTFWPVWTLARPKPEGPVTGPPPGTSLVPLEPLTLQVGSMSVWASLDRPLIALWVVSSSALLLLGLALLLRTRNLRKRCRGGEDGGREVLFSEELGPAVVGVFKPKIILPRWCEGMEEAGLRLILAHESEHLRARDLPLTVFSGVLPVFVPWSLPVWWMWHRLRIAAEGDCDLRVLKNNPGSSRTYMELLLEVGQRFPTSWAAAAMLSEPERTLARRIRTMTMPVPSKPLLKGTVLLGVGSILIAVACGVPKPTSVENESEPPSAAAPSQGEVPELSRLAREAIEEPSYTPLSRRPEITNRLEVALALEREYPPLLRDAGVTGRVSVWLFIDEEGRVRRTKVNESSGLAAFDDAAVRVAETIQFSPGMNGGEAVPVWISLPIMFSVRDAGDARIPEGPGLKGSTASDAGGNAKTPEATETPGPTEFTQAPALLNREEVLRAIEDHYPPLLRDAGIGGRVAVRLHIGEDGNVLNTALSESSGHKALDEAAIRVASDLRFTPALNGTKTVPVWISLPIQFAVREPQ